MKTAVALLACWAVLAGAARPDDYELVWSDEFATDGAPDPAKWGYETGYVRNDEAQYYTEAREANARIKDGVLIIEAKKEAFPIARPGRDRRTEAKYTSASLVTRGKAEWTRGRVEVRAKLPSGRGMWPAIWMLGTDIDRVGWPRCGEIDIMENVGFDPKRIHFNVHTQKFNHVLKTNKGASTVVEDAHDAFHTYAIEWTPVRIDFFVDGEKHFTFEKEGDDPAVWPFDRPHYLILNVAVGGGWGGQKGIDDAVFPQRMEVDYVRVYQRRDTAKR